MKTDSDIITMRKIYMSAVGAGLMIGMLFPLYSAIFLGLKNVLSHIYYIIGSLVIGFLIGIFSYRGIRIILIYTFRDLHRRIKDEVGIEKGSKENNKAKDGDEVERVKEALFDTLYTIGKNIKDIQGIFKAMEESYVKISMDAKERAYKINKHLSVANSALSSIEQMTPINVEINRNASCLSAASTGVSSSIIEMTASIEEVAEKSERSSSSLMDTSSSIEEMSASVKEVAKNIGFLSATAEETASAITGITASIKGVEENAGISFRMSREAAADAEDGKKSVTHTIEGMKRIKEVVESSASIIFALGKRSKEIGDILKVIKHVAKKTNLLAVNAGIIAAQSSEHAGEFAVVAGEIRELADHTASSIKEISNIIKTVQKESLDAVERIKVASISVTDGVRLSTRAGKSLDKILHSVNRSKEMVNQIAMATSEQTKGSRLVRDAIDNVTNLLKQMTKATSEQAAASEQIIKATENVKDISGEVKRITTEQAKDGSHITSSINEVTQRIRDISKAIEDRKRGDEEVISSMQNIAGIIREDADNISRIYSDLKGLISNGDRLKGCLNLFNGK